MDIRIDLDAAAAQILKRCDAWEAQGITVGALTWREVAEGWPPRLKTERSDVRNADSVGVALSRDARQGSVVLFQGGWADLLCWSGDPADAPVNEAVGWEDWLTVEKFGDLLDRLARCLE